jgi:hypothetical protein
MPILANKWVRCFVVKNLELYYYGVLTPLNQWWKKYVIL